MISINGIQFAWEEGMTMKNAVTTALASEHFMHLNESQLIYMLNNSNILFGRLDKTIVCDNDEINIYTIATGG